MDGKYWVTEPHNRGMSTLIPRSARIVVDYGCLIVLDEEGETICAYASGSWATIHLENAFQAEDGDSEAYGNLPLR